MGDSEKSYSRILKSSSIVGGAQGITMLISMVRVKFVAILLGPVGIGLLAVFQSIELMASMLCGLGLNASGVRDVAEANGSDDTERISRTVITLRRLCWVTGLVGAVLLAAFSLPLSHLTFHTGAYAGQIAWLSLAVLMASVSGGQMALIQGMRRIGDLARLNILTALAGSIIAIGFYWWLGMSGIVPALLTLAAVNLMGSFWFSRRIPIRKVSMPWKQSFIAAGGLVALGLAVMWDGLLAAVVEYVTRALISREIDLASVGIFTAAFRLSGMFLNFILGAMGADFYPSLTEVSDDHGKMRRLVSQQTEIGLLLAGPGLLATLTFAPLAIQLFYSGEFAGAAVLLQWFVLGCFGRVVSWPMAFVMLAKGKGGMFTLSQTSAYIFHVVAIWLGLKWMGIEGVAVAFVVFNIYYTLSVILISRRLIDYKWSKKIVIYTCLLLSVATVMMVVTRNSSLLISTMIGGVVTCVVGLYCVRSLCQHLDSSHRIVRLIGKIPFSRYFLKNS